MSVPTLDALIRVRETVPDEFSEFTPTSQMYDLFTSDMYKKELAKINDDNSSEDVDEIEFLSPTEAFLRDIELQGTELDESHEQIEEDDEEEE
jgi:hypothetical protein